MPSISPPINSLSAANTTDQVKLLRNLLAAFQTVPSYLTKVQARIQIAFDLQKSDIPVTISTEEKINYQNTLWYKQTVRVGNQLVFISPYGTLRNCAKWNGWQLFCFFDSLQAFIKTTEKGLLTLLLFHSVLMNRFGGKFSYFSTQQ